MIKDITIGQFFPGNSVIHKLDPRVKILLVIIFITVSFIISSIFSLLLVMSLILVAYKIAGISLKLILKGLKSVLFIIIFTSVINVFFTEGEIIWSFWKLSVSKEGIILTIILIARILDMIMISSLLTYTTSPVELTRALESLMKPLKVFKVPVSDLSMMMTISLRFVPTLINETDKIIMAQKSRGAKIDVGNIFQKVKSFIPVIVPLFVSAFKTADELAIAMEGKCYNGGEGKTSMKQLKLKKEDFLVIGFLILFFTLVFFVDKVKF